MKRKKILILIVSLINCSMFFASTSYALTTVSSEAQLKSALLGSDPNIQLNSDIFIVGNTNLSNALSISKTKTIDLNTHTLSVITSNVSNAAKTNGIIIQNTAVATIENGALIVENYGNDDQQNYGAGIYVTQNAKLVLNHINISARPGYRGAAIGSAYDSQGGSIEFLDVNGTIFSEGRAAGIGGGSKGKSGPVLIAQSSLQFKEAVINGYDGGAFIGSGDDGAIPSITIKDSVIDGSNYKFNQYLESALIGSGGRSGATSITIDNSTLKLVAAKNGAMIGGGVRDTGGSINIKNSSVEMLSSESFYGATIGSGYFSTGNWQIVIDKSNLNLSATNSSTPIIGGGANSTGDLDIDIINQSVIQAEQFKPSSWNVKVPAIGRAYSSSLAGTEKTNISIDDSFVSARSNSSVAIGTENSPNQISINGGKVIAVSAIGNEAIGVSAVQPITNSVVTIDNGNIYGAINAGTVQNSFLNPVYLNVVTVEDGAATRIGDAKVEIMGPPAYQALTFNSIDAPNSSEAGLAYIYIPTSTNLILEGSATGYPNGSTITTIASNNLNTTTIVLATSPPPSSTPTLTPSAMPTLGPVVTLIPEMSIGMTPTPTKAFFTTNSPTDISLDDYYQNITIMSSAPSPTESFGSIYDESVEEGTVSMPITGETTINVIIVVCLLGGGAFVIYRKRKKNR